MLCICTKMNITALGARVQPRCLTRQDVAGHVSGQICNRAPRQRKFFRIAQSLYTSKINGLSLRRVCEGRRSQKVPTSLPMHPHNGELCVRLRQLYTFTLPYLFFLPYSAPLLSYCIPQKSTRAKSALEEEALISMMDRSQI